MKNFRLPLLGFLTVLLPSALFMSGCSSMGKTEQGALIGAGVGAGAGSVVGNQLGSSGAGAAIGAGTGAVVGAVVGKSLDSDEDRQQIQEEILQRQKAEMERQKRELDDIRRQQYHNDSFRRFEAPPAGGAVAPQAPAVGEGPAYERDVAPAPGDDLRY